MPYNGHATEAPWWKNTEYFMFAYLLFTFSLRDGYLMKEEYLHGESEKYIQIKDLRVRPWVDDLTLEINMNNAIRGYETKKIWM